MSAAYRRPRKPSKAWAPAVSIDYTDVTAIVEDLAQGQLDLAGAERRIRALAETQHQAGILAGVEASTEQIRKLAEENRSLRVRLVQQSLAESAEVA